MPIRMESFWRNLFRRKASSEVPLDLLREIPVFAELSPRELAAITRILYRRQYAEGEVIFHQGDPGGGMYIVVEGTVTITYEPTGRCLATLKPGDSFGEISLLNETPRSATAEAAVPCTVYGFFRPELLGLLERDPRLGVKVLLPLAQIAGRRLINTDALCAELHEELEGLRPVRPTLEAEAADGS